MLERRLVQQQRELSEARSRETIMRIIIGALILLCILLAVIPAADASDGRRVDLGPWNGVIACESRGDGGAVNAYSGAAGVFQFLPSTWRGISPSSSLARVHPTEATLAQQYRQAERLRQRYGISQWVCGYRYGDGTPPQVIHSDRPTNAPKRCKTNLVDRWGLTQKQARQVCAA